MPGDLPIFEVILHHLYTATVEAFKNLCLSLPSQCKFSAASSDVDQQRCRIGLRKGRTRSFPDETCFFHSGDDLDGMAEMLFTANTNLLLFRRTSEGMGTDSTDVGCRHRFESFTEAIEATKCPIQYLTGKPRIGAETFP